MTDDAPHRREMIREACRTARRAINELQQAHALNGSIDERHLARGGVLLITATARVQEAVKVPREHAAEIIEELQADPQLPGELHPDPGIDGPALLEGGR